MSHRQSFLALVMNRFLGGRLYFIDEPEAALSLIRQLALLARLHRLALEGAQFIIATHSPLLLAYPQALILRLEADGIGPLAEEEPEHLRVTRQFLRNPAKSLAILFDQPSQGAASNVPWQRRGYARLFPRTGET
jgi:predicted ATPase